jgi:ABC-type nitrate/sulfonate/bicarbonate transport system substrate-binding protein
MRPALSRRVFGAAVVAAMACASAGLPTQTARAADPITFNIGISAPATSILPVYFADAGGFYAKYGLKTQIVNAEGGTRGLQVLLSGEIQGMHVGLAPAVQANLQGADLRLVAASINVMPFVFFGKKDAPASFRKGSTVGISTFGSETDIAISVALKSVGLTRDDVTISQIGGTGQRYAALLAGRVDAAPLLQPAIAAAKQRGFPVILDLAEAKTPWIFDAVVVSRAYAQANPEAVTRFLKAYLEGSMKALGDEAWARDVIGKRFKTTDAAVIEATYQDFKQNMTRDAAPSVASAKNVLEQLKALNLPAGSQNPNDYLDLSFIDKLKSEGFIDAMLKQYNVK